MSALLNYWRDEVAYWLIGCAIKVATDEAIHEIGHACRDRIRARLDRAAAKEEGE